MGNKRYEIVTFLRGFSILAIILFHYLMYANLKPPFNKLIYGGGTGVHVFILLSGFGLYLSDKKNPLPFFHFLKKRLVKIYIPYIIIVSLTALISFFIPLYKNSMHAFLGHIFLYKMFDEAIIGSYGYPLWFISMLIQFYLLFKVFVFFIKKFPTILFFTICLILSIFWSFIVIRTGHSTVRVWNSFFLQYLWEFSLGMILADKITNLEEIVIRIKNRKPPLFTLFFLLIGISACIIYGYLAIKTGTIGKTLNDIPALFGFSFIAIFIYLLNIKPIIRFLHFTGEISFQIYLLHMLIFDLFTFFYSPSIVSIMFSLLLSYILGFYFKKLSDRFF